ncbi:MAG: TonB-dependent receptor [Deltaproteobacteria bacterium]|nr:TonB-dependent receptor [Deltaproteobacteria bacterium]
MCSFRSGASAWHARRRPLHRFPILVALLAGGAGGLRPCVGHAQDKGEPVYETVVTARSAVEETPREDRAAASAVITADRTPRAAESVPQLLSEQAGASVTRLGGMGAGATLSLRGSTANQVLVYVDGAPLNTATGGGVDLGAIPLGDVERIEIYRGTSPIGFGASAIGGVVSLTTVVPRESHANFATGSGSFGTNHASARAVFSQGRARVYVGAHALGSEGDFPYVDSKGTNLDPGDDQATRRRNNDLRQVDGLARAEVDLAAGRRLRAQAMLFAREQGLPGIAMLANPTARLGTFRATGIVTYESTRDLGAGSRVRATTYGNYLLSHFADKAGQVNATPTDAWDRTYTAGGTLDWRKALRPWLSLAGVLDGRYDRFLPTDALSTSLSGAPGTRLFGAAGCEGDLLASAPRLDVVASLRVEAAREATSGRDNFNHLATTQEPKSHLLPIVRLSFAQEAASWLSLRANGGRYSRLPSLVEIYGNTGYLLGNTGLKPESGLNADFGPVLSWQGNAAAVTWSTAVFASWASDLIAYRMGGGRARAENVGSARIVGVESSARLALGTHARLFASATLTDARDTTSREAYRDRQLALRPRYRFYARPEWRDIALAPSVSLGLYAEIDGTAGNYLDPANTLRVPARLLLGAGIYASLPDGFRLRASARNLADARVHDIADYPLPGREFHVTLVWSSPNPKTKE